MRQFTQESLLASLLKSGRVDDGLIDSLARAIAEYHRTARTDEAIAQFGQPERICRVLRDNYRQTERFIGGPQTAEQYAQTQHFTDAFCNSRSDLLSSASPTASSANAMAICT